MDFKKLHEGVMTLAEQTIEASISVPVPKGYVLVKESRLVELEENELKGYWWGIKDVLARINRGRNWFTENVLESPKWRKVIDIENGGFVYYPQTPGDKFSFLPTRTIDFLEENFNEILKK